MRSIRTLLTILSLTALPVFAQPVHIPDSNLRAAVRDTLGLPDGTPITRDVMLQLTKLDVTGHGHCRSYRFGVRNKPHAAQNRPKPHNRSQSYRRAN